MKFTLPEKSMMPFKLRSSPHNRAVLRAASLLTGLLAIATMTPSPQLVNAQQASRQATANSWQAASFPVENFQAYTSPFGYRRSATGGYNVEFHKGLDIAAPQGSYVRNWWAGTVVKVGDQDACGTHITIKSGEWEHTYCHMQGHVEASGSGRYLMDREGGVQLAEGQQVLAGARIGRVGMTGRTTGPHLHWGMKYGDKYVDPAMVLQAMYSQQSGVYASARPRQSSVTIDESKYIRDTGY